MNRYLPPHLQNPLADALAIDPYARSAPSTAPLIVPGPAAPNLHHMPLGGNIDDIMGAVPREREETLRSSKSRSNNWTPIAFGDGHTSHGQLGILQDDGVDYQARTLYVQLDFPVSTQMAVADMGIVDAGGFPVFPVVELDFGAHGMPQTVLVDIQPGTILRIPLVASKVVVTGRMLQFPGFALHAAPHTVTQSDYQLYNFPTKGGELAPVADSPFFMRAYCAEGIVGSNLQAVTRKFQASATGAGSVVIPTAAGAYAGRLIGDSSKLSYSWQVQRPGGTNETIGPIPANVITEMPSGAAGVVIIATAAADWEFEFFLSLA